LTPPAGASDGADFGGLAPESVALYRACARELASGLKTLPDKPEETVETTLAALWHAAAGRPLSVRRASDAELPVLDDDGVARLRALLLLRIEGTPLAHLTGR